jgi:hypothetical protein
MGFGFGLARRGCSAPAVAFAFFAALLASCAATPETLTPPRIEVVGLHALKSTAERQHFQVSLLIDNLNTEPLEIADIRFTLRLAGEGQLQGKSGPVTVPALTRETIRLDVDSDIVSSLSRLLAVVQGPSNALPYEIYGNVISTRRFQKPMQFAFSGEVPLSMAQQ